MGIPVRVTAAFALAFYIAFIIFLVQVLRTSSGILDRTRFCGGQLEWGWKWFAMALLVLAIIGCIGAVVSLAIG